MNDAPLPPICPRRVIPPPRARRTPTPRLRTPHDFRVVNYVLSTNILHQAEGMATGTDPTVAAQLDAAVAAALAITAESTKSEIRDARGLLHLAVGDADAADESDVPTPVV